MSGRGASAQQAAAGGAAPGDSEADYYRVLGLDRDTATPEEVRKAYRAAALRWHPDKAGPGAEDMFKLVAEAYAVLSDPRRKAAYDAYGVEGVQFAAATEDRAAEEGAHEGTWRRAGPADPAGHGGPGRRSHAGPVPHVSAAFADEVFRAFFGGRDPFADFFGDAAGHGPFGSHPFGGLFGGGLFGGLGMGMGMGMGGGGGWGGGGTAMDGGMFGGGGGSGGGMVFTSFSSSSWSSSGGVGTGSSVQTHTTIEDGHQVTRTTRTVRHADGRVETHTDEQRQPLALGDGGRVGHAPRTLPAPRTAGPADATSVPARRSVPVVWHDGADAPAPPPHASTGAVPHAAPRPPAHAYPASGRGSGGGGGSGAGRVPSAPAPATSPVRPPPTTRSGVAYVPSGTGSGTAYGAPAHTAHAPYTTASARVAGGSSGSGGWRRP